MDSDSEGVESGNEDTVTSRLEEGKYLPAIYRLQLPETRTKSALIRWLCGLGYPVKEISRALNMRYQQVRNVVTTEPKRATREDTPPLEIVLSEDGDVEDIVDMLLGEALESDFRAARKQERRQEEEG